MSCESIRADIDQRGFAQMEAVFSASELGRVEAILDGLMAGSRKVARPFRREMSSERVSLRLLQPELMRPSLLSRSLRHSEVYRRCQNLASELLGVPAHYLFDHAIYKMPMNQTETPWHQDQAYLGEDVFIRSVHFWIPLQDVSAANGTMKFVDGSHRQLLKHRSIYPQNPHILSIDAVPDVGVHELNIRKGGLSVHTNMTLHAAGANHANQIRKAWILHFGERPAWHKRWLQVKRLVRPQRTSPVGQVEA